jgi:hypothetical protein
MVILRSCVSYNTTCLVLTTVPPFALQYLHDCLFLAPVADLLLLLLPQLHKVDLAVSYKMDEDAI